MVEILLSLVLLIAAAALALWPWVGIHDHTIDGLFLAFTGLLCSCYSCSISSGNCARKVLKRRFAFVMRGSIWRVVLPQSSRTEIKV